MIGSGGLAEPDERPGVGDRRRARAARRVRQDPADQGLGAGRNRRRLRSRRPARPAVRGRRRPRATRMDGEVVTGLHRRRRRRERVRARPGRPLPRDVPADPAAGPRRARSASTRSTRTRRRSTPRSTRRAATCSSSSGRWPRRCWLLLFLAFSGASRLLARQNRDLRRSEERFRSLVQNSIDVQVIADATGRIAYESARRRTGPRLPGRGSHRPASPSTTSIRTTGAWAQQMLRDVAPAPGSQVVRRGARSPCRRLLARRSRPSRRTSSTTRPSAASSSTIATSPARKSLEDELQAPGLPRLADRPGQPRPVRRPPRARDLAGRALADARWRCCSSISTTSRPSTTASATARATSCSSRSRTGSGPALRAGDTIARMGGDEFAILIEDPVDGETPVEVGRRLLAPLEAPFVHGGKELFVRASIGDRDDPVARSHRRRGPPQRRRRDVHREEPTARTGCEVFEPGMHAAALDPAGAEGRPRARPRARRVHPRLPADRRPRRRARCRASRRSCAGSTASAGRSARPSSSRSPRRPA